MPGCRSPATPLKPRSTLTAPTTANLTAIGGAATRCPIGCSICPRCFLPASKSRKPKFLSPPSSRQRYWAKTSTASFSSTLGGAGWLPADIVLSRYQDAQVTLLHDYENSLPNTGKIAGVTAQEAGFTSVNPESLVTREPDISQNNIALRLAWDQPGAAYTLSVPPGLAHNAHGVTFALAPADEQQPPADLTIKLQDAAGRVARLSLGDAAALPVLLPAQLVKNKPAADLFGVKFPFDRAAERFLQTEILPFEQFEAEPGFDPGQIVALHFVFDRVAAGAVLLDEIGLVQ